MRLDQQLYLEALEQERLELALFNPRLHPRNLLGQFREIFGDGDLPSVTELTKTVTDAIGVDPFDADVSDLWKHARACGRSPLSRFGNVKSPCNRSKKVDFAVHVWLPSILREKYPNVADKLSKTSPRWGRRHFPTVNPVRTTPLNP